MSIVLSDSTLEDSIDSQRCPSVLLDIDNFVLRRVTSTTSLLNRVKQMLYNSFNEVDFAGSKALKGMKVANIKPQKVSSSSLLAKMSSPTGLFIRVLSIRESLVLP